MRRLKLFDAFAERLKVKNWILIAGLLFGVPAYSQSPGIEVIKKLVNPAPTPCPMDPSASQAVLTKSTYSCSAPAAPGAKTDQAVMIEFYHSNDNLLLGLYRRVTGAKDGNDFGNTSDFSLKVSVPVNDHRVFTATAGSELYTKGLEFQNSFAPFQYNFQVRDPSGRVVNQGQQSGTSQFLPGNKFNYGANGHWRYPVRLIDVSRFLVQMKEGKNFYYTIEAGVEARSRNPGLGATIQDRWHRGLGIYTFDYIDPGERQALYQTTTSQSSRLLMTGGGTLNAAKSGMSGVDPMNAYTISEQVESKTLVSPQVGSEVLKYRIAPVAVLLNVGAGATKSARVSGQCTLTGEASTTAHLVFENGGLGQNSKLANKLVFAAKIKNLNFRGGMALNYYFMEGDRITGSTSRNGFTPPEQIKNGTTLWGIGSSLEASYDLNTGPNKRVVYTPFVSIEQQKGRLEFQEFNDTDPMMNIGIRMKFKK